MNKYKVNTLLIIIFLLLGTFINKVVAKVETNNVISTTKATTNKTVYHISYDISQVEFCDSLIKDTYKAKIITSSKIGIVFTIRNTCEVSCLDS